MSAGYTKSYTFGPVKVELIATGSRIIFPDGAVIPGEPEDTDDYRATALSYGYGDDTLKLCQDHELLHVAMCHWLGVDSVVLRALRDKRPCDDSRCRMEEDAVLAIQRFANAMGADLSDRLD